MQTKHIVYGLIGLTGAVVFIHEMVKWGESMKDRIDTYDAALQYARLTGKPFLVVGRPMDMYPCGDYTLDLHPKGECPNEIQADICDLKDIPDKTFGSVFASHVLEHIQDIEKGFQELNRIADRVFISYPFPHTITAYTMDHKWLIYSAPPDSEYIIYRRILFR